jgi:hypothetical protein
MSWHADSHVFGSMWSQMLFLFAIVNFLNKIIQFNSILIYLHANLRAQGQLQSEHELR